VVIFVKYAAMRKIHTASVFFQIVLAVTVVNVTPTYAQDALEECRVPICDVDAYIAELRVLPRGERIQKIMKEFPVLLEANRKSKDFAVWSNLADLGGKTLSLATEIGDEDYVIREASNMLDVGMLGVHRYGPVTTDALISSFKKIVSSGRRLEALKGWENIEKEQSSEKVQEVVNFAVLAEAHARELDDPEWVIAMAKQIAFVGTVRLAALDPMIEGHYAVKLTRDPNSDLLLCAEIPNVDTLMIANWMTSEGLVATLMGQDLAMHLGYFKNLVISEAGAKVAVKSLSFQTSSRIAITIDKVTGTVKGSYTSTRRGCTYQIDGKLIHSPGMYLRDGSLEGMGDMPTVKSVSGVYEAVFQGQSMFGGRKSLPQIGRFVIRPHLQPNGSSIAASWITATLNQDFQYGYVAGARAFMIFNSGTGEHSLIRWDMAYRPDEKGEWAWRGYMYSFRNGSWATFVLKKIADLGPDDDDNEATP